MKLLWISGGLRVGDTFHCIPQLNRLTEEYKDITWVTGTYAREASHFLGHVYNIKVITIGDACPTDLSSREEFSKKVKETINLSHYDKVIDGTAGSFDLSQNKAEYSRLKFTPKEAIDKDPYIVVQNHSWNTWKKVEAFNKVRFPYNVYSLGLPGEEILPGTKDFRYKTIEEIANLICHAKLFVGIHSAMTCLAFYTNTKGLACHFMKGGLLNFSEYRNDWIDDRVCTKESIETNINKLIQGDAK